MAQPTNELRIAIQALHAAIGTERDPKHIQILSQCLQNMTRVQAELMQQGGTGGQQQAAQAPSQQGPPQPPPQLAAMLSQLGAR